MNVLVIGSGGREHALVWKLLQSPRVKHIFVAPGNGGTVTDKSSNVPIPVTATHELVQFSLKNSIDLSIVGPEEPLALGIVDSFQAAGLRIFGPQRQAAQLEASKSFAKQLMQDYSIPTADFAVFGEAEVAAAERYVERMGKPVVVKAHGLAAGKGVLICDSPSEAKHAIRRMLVEHEFGAAGKEIVIEERLQGKEASVMAFADGKSLKLMPAVRDHKRALDHDQGPNTGGMGAYTPLADLSDEVLASIKHSIMLPTLRAMAAEGLPYIGILYAGIMLTQDGPKVLEFNCRFGDPETQVIMPLLETDLVDIIEACLEQRLESLAIRWKEQACITVVAAAPGYPGHYPKDLAVQLPSSDELIFQAGTQVVNGQIFSTGGRVLAVSSLGQSLGDARERAYATLQDIHFDGMHYRQDIGAVQSAYAAAGVDIGAGAETVAQIKDAVQATYTQHVLAGVGAFGGMFEVSFLKAMQAPVLVASTDGVGTKTRVAAKLKRWDGIGQDLVHHCVNDILVQGAKPLFFLDYVAASKLEPATVSLVVKGMAQACRALGIALLGGETAEMPGVYAAGEIDVVGTIIGAVEKAQVLDGSRLEDGDAILGLASSGLHTNGYSLARQALGHLDWTEHYPTLGSSIGEALLAVHRPYLREIEVLQDAGLQIKGLAHITGGGIVDNLPRILPDSLGAVIDTASWSPPAIFDLIQEHGNVNHEEMFQVFNMGMGMLVLVSANDVAQAREVLPELTVIGTVTKGQRTIVLT